jgi:Tfp pilus assembly protein PilV
MTRRATNRGGTPSRDTRRGAGGSTLIEVLIASVIMSTAVIVLITGLGTLFATSIQSRETTTAGVVARSYAEGLVVAVAKTGAWCSSTYAVAYSPPTGYGVSAALGACPAGNATTAQYQTATITATTPKGATETLRMVVRES